MLRPSFHSPAISSTKTTSLPFPHSKSHRRKTSLSPSATAGKPLSDDTTLLRLLRQRKTEEAFEFYSQCPQIPNPNCLSRLLAQLAYQSSPASLSRAQSLVRRLRDARLLHRLDANSLGLLAVAAAKSGNAAYALSVIRSMLRSGYLPHVKSWSAVVSSLASNGDADDAIRLFDSVLRRIAATANSPLAANSRPDTAAFNAALNAASNLGDAALFAKVFDEMPAYDAKPDVLTYNVLIKLCARAERRDLVVFVLERIIRSGIVPCITTFHSLVAAYVGLGDLPIAEKLVQFMREGRRDICHLLRAETSMIVNRSSEEEETETILNKLVGIAIDEAPPLLPKTYNPDTRIYTTLMKGYMKASRADDALRMVSAMRREVDPASHPDIVTYTTAITALANVGAMDRARQLFDEMSQFGITPNRVAYNVLLKGYCAQLQIDKAKALIRSMADDANAVGADVFSYNILIDGCILVDDNASALTFFNEMRERGIPPSQVSYTTLMKAFALSGQPKLAHKVFDEMSKDKRVKVDLVSFNMLVEGYCRLGLIEEGKRVIEKMKEKGFSPDVATYGSLANGIALARKPVEALLLWNEVKERRGFRPDEGLLDALADVCVRAALFKKALEIVACMEENGLSPNKTKYKRIYVEMHSRMFTSKHASMARQARRSERKRAAEAFKFWLGLPNSYYGSEWRLEPMMEDD